MYSRPCLAFLPSLPALSAFLFQSRSCSSTNAARFSSCKRAAPLPQRRALQSCYESENVDKREPGELCKHISCVSNPSIWPSCVRVLGVRSLTLSARRGFLWYPTRTSVACTPGASGLIGYYDPALKG
ncbi:hypothetical protein OH76DRAFT_1409118 [Lentinus brumalis]|uniref:Secreted protein n=1 Tax=Lentinus brumalis TaxID=2498619 RepID=A0A371CVW1_9APHY|nr:hypothetical protein OH76DRAFT_1409118 [Polyporus brumalis]